MVAFLRVLAVLVACASSASAFAPSRSSPMGAMRRPRPQAAPTVTMGSMAKFGVFSPAVYAGRLLLGDKSLESVRGKGISLHSQAINEFCLFVGAPARSRVRRR